MMIRPSEKHFIALDKMHCFMHINIKLILNKYFHTQKMKSKTFIWYKKLYNNMSNLREETDN